MKKYVVFLFSIVVLVLICLLLTQNLRIENVVQEMIIKEIIPYKLSKAFSTQWERVVIIKSEKVGKEWRCYFFALSSEKSNEFFIATVFDPPEEIEDQINYLTVAEDVSFAYLLKIAGLKNRDDIKGFEIFHSKISSPPNYVGFLVLRLKNVQINKRPFKEYL